MDSLWFGSWKDLSLGWWNALASAWFPASAILKVWHCGSNFVLVYAIVHEKSRTDIRESWPSFSGRAALGLSFREHKRRNGKICPFRFEDIILLTMDPGRVISNHHDSSRIGSCQLSCLLGGFRWFHFGWSFWFQQIIFHRCQQSMVSTMRSDVLTGINSCDSYKL